MNNYQSIVNKLNDISLENKDISIIFQMYEIGDIAYQARCKECFDLLDIQKIMQDISLQFPEINHFKREQLFPKDNHPKYFSNNFINHLSTFYKTKVSKTSNEIREYYIQKYLRVYDWIKNYWDNYKPIFLEVDQRYDNLINLIVEKFKPLEKDRDMENIVNLISDIKEEFILQSQLFIDNKKYLQNKDKIIIQLRENYLPIFNNICKKRNITDEILVQKLFEINNVSKSMIELGFTVDYFSKFFL